MDLRVRNRARVNVLAIENYFINLPSKFFSFGNKGLFSCSYHFQELNFCVCFG